MNESAEHDVEPATDEDAGPDAEETTSADGGDRTQAPVRRRRWLPWALMVLMLLVAIVAVAWGATRSPTDDGGLARARKVAAKFGAAYLTFDSTSVNQSSDQLLALMTDSFASEFRTTRLPTVSQLFSGKSTTTRATVTDTYASTLADGRVRVLVLVDVDATASAGSQRLVNLSFVITLVDHGGWLVDGVDPVPVPKVIDPSTTSTTAPTAPTDTTPPPHDSSGG